MGLLIACHGGGGFDKKKLLPNIKNMFAKQAKNYLNIFTY